MLSEERIRKMIRLSEFETGQGGTDLKRLHYKKMDYVRVQLLKTGIYVAIACLLTVVLVVMYRMEYWVKNLFELPYRQMFIWFGVGFILCEIIALIVTGRIASIKYEESKLRVKEYDVTLRELLELYEDEEGQEETIV